MKVNKKRVLALSLLRLVYLCTCMSHSLILSTFTPTFMAKDCLSVLQVN